MTQPSPPADRTLLKTRFGWRLLTRLGLAALPPLLIVGAAAAVWERTGEFATAADVVRAQTSGRAVLFGQVYSNRTRAYKWQATQAHRASVLALGSSRVLQFRAEAFSSPFFNAGGTVDCLDDLGVFLFSLPAEARPRHLVLGLDQWWFNGAYEAPGCRAFTPVEDGLARTFVASWLYTWSDFLAGKFSLRDLASPAPGPDEPVGLNAWLNRNGFRRDGSYYYGGVVADPGNPLKNADIGFHGTLARIRAGAARFTPGQTVDLGRLSALRRFLRRCRQLGIRVTAFLPPFPHAVIREMDAFRDRYHYMADLPSLLAQVSRDEGVSFADMTDLKALGFSDEEAIDGYHCSEKAYLAILLRLAEGDPALAAHLNDPGRLQARLARAGRRFEAF